MHRQEPPGLTPERQELARSYLGMANSIAAEMGKRHPRLWHDLHGVASEALVEAAARFHDRETFGAFAAAWIKGALKSAIRQEVPHGYRYTDTPGPVVESYGDWPDEWFPAPDDGSPEVLTTSIEEVEHMLRRVTPRRRQLLRLMFVYGKSRIEAATEMGIKRSQASALYRSAIDELKRARSRDQGQAATYARATA